MRFLWLLVVLLLSASGCAGEGGDGTVKDGKEKAAGDVRRPAVAGQFYPGSPDSLARDVDRYLAAARVPELDGEVVGIVSPHAGYMYSGAVAAHGYSYLKGKRYDTVIVVAPSHRMAFRGSSVYARGAYETPLGLVQVDSELASAILDESAGIIEEPRAHLDEHSLEVQIPFLQRTLDSFRIVPIVMGDQSSAASHALGRRIAKAVLDAGDRKVLLVASTDLSHYHDQATAEALDERVLEALSAFDPDGLLRSLAARECEACGGGPTAAVMVASRELGADEALVLKYATSGDVTGDESQVVGYVSAVLARRAAGGASPAEGAATASAGAPKPYQGLTPAEKKALLVLARGSIEAALAGARAPEAPLRSDALDAECGAFVTLTRRGELRGCIGYVRAVKPLRRTVAEMAVQAALHDPRFSPVSASELPGLDIEISVLSPLEEVKDVSTIEVGKHGLVIQEGSRSGLLLPQVATEYGWDRETFLDHTCMKAGLPAGSWRKKGVVILRFTAEVFGEKDEGGGD
jgi:AmmeMemoRadiSam system protein B/AmmeMemoRadiSam system protein A